MLVHVYSSTHAFIVGLLRSFSTSKRSGSDRNTTANKRTIREILDEQRRFIVDFRESIDRRRQLLEPINQTSTRKLGSSRNALRHRLSDREVVVHSHHISTCSAYQSDPNITHMQGTGNHGLMTSTQLPRIILPPTGGHVGIREKDKTARILLTPNTKHRVQDWLDNLHEEEQLQQQQ